MTVLMSLSWVVQMHKAYYENISQFRIPIQTVIVERVCTQCTNHLTVTSALIVLQFVPENDDL